MNNYNKKKNKFKVEVEPKPIFQTLFMKYMHEKNKYGADLYGGIRKDFFTPIDKRLYSKLLQKDYRPSKATIIICVFYWS